MRRHGRSGWTDRPCVLCGRPLRSREATAFVIPDDAQGFCIEHGLQLSDFTPETDIWHFKYGTIRLYHQSKWPMRLTAERTVYDPGSCLPIAPGERIGSAGKITAEQLANFCC